MRCAAVAIFGVFNSDKLRILAFLAKFFLYYSLEGFLAVQNVEIRVQRHRIKQGDISQTLLGLAARSGIADLAKYFEKHRFGTIFIVFESFRKPTSDPSISGHWPHFPRSSAPDFQRLLRSGTERLLVE